VCKQPSKKTSGNVLNPCYFSEIIDKSVLKNKKEYSYGLFMLNDAFFVVVVCISDKNHFNNR